MLTASRSASRPNGAVFSVDALHGRFSIRNAGDLLEVARPARYLQPAAKLTTKTTLR
jgi:hypothetical protein